MMGDMPIRRMLGFSGIGVERQGKVFGFFHALLRSAVGTGCLPEAASLCSLPPATVFGPFGAIGIASDCGGGMGVAGVYSLCPLRDFCEIALGSNSAAQLACRIACEAV